ncbi:MAG TPA: hypothetical protein ENK18_25510, partial [Deltaproteobacteria bacterium]|nr:hypothetical protein [Deltaproteobacteria bacterium]
MSTRPRFILPTELKLKLTPEGIDIEYDGDVELEQDLGQSLHKVIASGDLTVKLQRVTGSLQCGGTLRIHGEIDAEHIHGREVVLGRQKVRCTSISANERITVGAASLTVDAIIAPEINLDPKASGRVTVIESDNDRGATKIKGGFSVSDYDDMFGNADEFLAQRGLQRLGEAGPAPGRAVISSAVHDPPEVTEEEDTSDPLSLSLE